jgi:sulfur relay (sulfurtransferase) DsrC/TusE family protein
LNRHKGSTTTRSLPGGQGDLVAEIRDTGLTGPNGFFTDPQRWEPDHARKIAAEPGIGEMGSAHWRVIEHLRAHFLAHGTLPWDSHVCRHLGLDERCIHRLFGGPIEAWKVAGLPDPGEEARTYMLNQEP